MAMNEATPPSEHHPSGDTLVEVEDLSMDFPIRSGVLNRVVGHVHALDQVSFTIPRGKTFGLVGESGSGKTTVARCILRILEPTGGSVRFNGEEITDFNRSAMTEFRKNAQIVWQDPTSSLNPKKSVRYIITKPLRVHGVGTKGERTERAVDLLETVGLSEEFLNKHPGTLSGGQKQRVGIARALALNPDLVVLDEPTSALDVSVQARIIELLEELQDELNLTYLFISHDLSLVRNISDVIGVMYMGEIVETGSSEEIFYNPQHPYTRGLMSAIPTLTKEDEDLKPETFLIEGEIPDPRDKPSGCSFRTRCPMAFEHCAVDNPPMYELEGGRLVRCYLHDDDLDADRPDWLSTQGDD